MHNRRPQKALVAARPLGRLRQRQMDLHIAAPIPKTAGVGCNPVRNHGAIKHLEVQLLRRYAAYHRTPRVEFALRGPHARHLAAAHNHLFHGRIGVQFRAQVAKQFRKTVDQPGRSAAWYRHPDELERHRDERGHKTRGRGVGPVSGMKHPRRQQTVNCR